MTVHTINSSVDGARAYVALEHAGADRDVLASTYEGIQQYLASEFEADGYTGEEIDQMDLESFADEIIKRERSAA